jgi:hypothetical protein
MLVTRERAGKLRSSYPESISRLEVQGDLYEVLTAIDAGGLGEVYRAPDAKPEVR